MGFARRPLSPRNKQRKMSLTRPTSAERGETAMRSRRVVISLAILLSFSATGMAQIPRITGLDPLTAKVGDVVTATGEALGSAVVDELYLTSGGEDLKVEIVEQTDNLIKFRVPAGIKSGRWAPMTHMKSE